MAFVYSTTVIEAPAYEVPMSLRDIQQAFCACIAIFLEPSLAAQNLSKTRRGRTRRERCAMLASLRMCTLTLDSFDMCLAAPSFEAWNARQNVDEDSSPAKRMQLVMAITLGKHKLAIGLSDNPCPGLRVKHPEGFLTQRRGMAADNGQISSFDGETGKASSNCS